MTKRLIVVLCVCVGWLTAVRTVADTRYETQVISPQSLFGWVGGFGFDGTTLVAATQLDSNYRSQQLRAFQVDQQNNLIEQAPILPPAYIADRFGGVLSLSGDFALMGAPSYPSTPYVDVGIATVLHRGTGGWSSVGQFFGASGYDFLGQAVDLNGRQLIVGEPGRTVFGGTGQAYVATIPTDLYGNWNEQLLKGSGGTHDADTGAEDRKCGWAAQSRGACRNSRCRCPPRTGDHARTGGEAARSLSHREPAR